MENKLPSPSEEFFAAVVRGAISSIPVAGSLLGELHSCLSDPLEMRKRAWQEEIETAVQVLKDRFNRLPMELASDPAFVSAYMKTYPVAIATHNREKLRALSAFLIAVGSRAIPGEERQNALLRLIDDLTAGHIEVLRFLESNFQHVVAVKSLEKIFAVYQSQHGGNLDRMSFRLILADLASRLVIHLGDLADMEEYASQRSSIEDQSSKIRPPQITELGQQLLALLRADT